MGLTVTVLKLPYVQKLKCRHGHQRYYFRRAGYGRVTLPGLPGSAEFMAAYQAAIAGETAPKRVVGADRTKAGTFNALAVAYYTSADFKTLALSTQATYRGIIERFRNDHGDKPIAMLEARHIRKILDEKVATPAAANNLLKILHVLMQFAIERDWRRDDPTAGVRKVRSSSKGFHTWSEEEIAAFEAHWPRGSRARLALALLLYTAQRRSDVVKMGRQHVRGDTIQVVPQKTANSSGARLAIRLHAELRSELALVPANQLTFLQVQGGRPFSPAGFTNWFVECAEAAGLPAGCTPHGLRKAAARRLAEVGCSAHEIMAITGHTTLKEVARYTMAADQESRARRAIGKLAEPSSKGEKRTAAVNPK